VTLELGQSSVVLAAIRYYPRSHVDGMLQLAWSTSQQTDTVVDAAGDKRTNQCGDGVFVE